MDVDETDLTGSDCHDSYKVVTVGDVGVGKTSLVMRIALNRFMDPLPSTGIDLVPTIVDTGSENVGKVEVSRVV